MTKKAKSLLMSLNTEFKPQTQGQREYIRSLCENDVTIATGPPGTGKSFLCLGLASQYLLEQRYDKIVVARPAVEASPKGLGYVPGDIMDKISPHLYPAIEHLKLFLGKDRYNNYLRDGVIQYESLEYMRGRTFNYSFVIIEEAQNATMDQLKMAITRIGKQGKMVLNGDVRQTDLKHCDLKDLVDILERHSLKGFSCVQLSKLDIIRNELIGRFLELFGE